MTPGNSRPSTPITNRSKDAAVNKLVYQVDRDTLVNEPNEPVINTEYASSPSSTKRPPVPPPIPARNHVTVDPTSNQNVEKARKQAEQPPELPPKIGRSPLTITKPVAPPNPATAALVNNNIQLNKENEEGGTAPASGVKLIQRQKSKTSRKKMTEDEAIQELGLFSVMSL